MTTVSWSTCLHPSTGIPTRAGSSSRPFTSENLIVSDQEASQWILFSAIDEATFSRDFLETESPLWSSYSTSEQALLIKMRTPEHAHSAGAFNKALMKAVQPMGLIDALRYLQDVTCQEEDRQQAPDHAWGPRRLPHGRSRKWPTVVLEIAVSEAQSKLQSDVRFWLGQPDVKVALTLAVDRKKPAITIAKWEVVDGRQRRTQDIRIWKRNKHGRDIFVSDDPLEIGFEKLFLRPPESPREGDVRVGRQELIDLATEIWEEQEF